MSRGDGRISVRRGASHESAGPTGARTGGSGPIGSQDGAEIPDRQAIAQVRDGDHAAFRVLVERYQARALRVAWRVLRDEEQARDAVQEAFLKAYRSLRRFEGRSSFYTWLYRLVVNVCLDMRRRERPEVRVDWEEGGALDGASDAHSSTGIDDPSQGVERAELGAALQAAIAALPDTQRETLLLREVEGLSYAEIAEALGISKGTVMSRLHYARRKVQDALIASGSVVATPAAPSRRAALGDVGVS